MIQGILLAAGHSRRYGGDKLLALLDSGVPVAVETARKLKQGGVDATLAVLRPAQMELAQRLQAEGVNPVFAPQAEAGMGHSLAAGIAASRDADGWVVALADMPAIQTGTIAAIATALRQGLPLVAPVWQGRRGHPVGFSAIFRDELLQLSGDQGARELLRHHAPKLLDSNDPGILFDLDMPEDLRRLGVKP
jgi:molybdenum cofactor cytidylyltransferase